MIRYYITFLLVLLLIQVAWSGTVKAKGKLSSITPIELAETLESQFMGLQQWDQGEVKLTFTRKLRTIKVPENSTLKLSGLSDDKPVGKILLKLVVLDASNSLFRNYYFPANVSVSLRIPVAKNKISRHAILTEDDFTLEEKDLTRLPRGVVTDLQDVLDHRSKTSIHAGQYVLSHQIEETPLVEKNEMILIRIISGALEVRGRGLALESGKRGDTIRVKNLDSKKIIYGKIIDDGIVTIEI